MTEDEVVEYVIERLRITWDEEEKPEEVLVEAIEDCISMFKRLSNDLDRDTFTKNDANWIKRACKEIIQRTDDGLIGLTEYQEGNIHYTFQREYLSKGLILEIYPIVGYPT